MTVIKEYLYWFLHQYRVGQSFNDTSVVVRMTLNLNNITLFYKFAIVIVLFYKKKINKLFISSSLIDNFML